MDDGEAIRLDEGLPAVLRKVAFPFQLKVQEVILQWHLSNLARTTQDALVNGRYRRNIHLRDRMSRHRACKRAGPLALRIKRNERFAKHLSPIAELLMAREIESVQKSGNADLTGTKSRVN